MSAMRSAALREAGHPRRCASAIRPGWSRSRPTGRLAVWLLAVAGAAGQPLPDDSFLLRRSGGPDPAGELAGKVDPANDRFETEVYAEEIAERLHTLADRLQHGTAGAAAVGEVLAPEFRGAPLEGPAEATVHGPLELFESSPSQELELDRGRFVTAFQAFAGRYREMLAAEFHVTAVLPRESNGALVVDTEIRYALNGQAEGGRRVQQTGQWHLAWARSAGEWRVLAWRSGRQKRAEAARPLFRDVTERALGANESYWRQLRPGIDHWRATLDAALGIDVYGHHGVSLGDIDGDGDDDLYVSQPSGLPNRLYRNEGGLAFADITAESGTGALDSTSMALFADLDGDDDQDLLLVAAQGPILLLNDGSGSFRRKPDAFRFALDPQGQLTSAALADYDRDGDLDLYVCSYRYHAGTGSHRPPTPYHDANNGPPNYLLRNRGDGSYEDVTAASGLDRNNARFSFGASWGDYDGDGWPDLYVANDFGRNNLYRNLGDGTFSDTASLAGVEDVGAGMSAAWFDYDLDGRLDLYVGNMWSSAGLRIAGQPAFRAGSAPESLRLYRRHAKGNSLFRGLGGGRFEEVSGEAGVARGRWAWSSDAVDLDNDGFEELYIANGYVTNAGARDL